METCFDDSFKFVVVSGISLLRSVTLLLEHIRTTLILMTFLFDNLSYVFF